jgi:hypothetical protein
LRDQFGDAFNAATVCSIDGTEPKESRERVVEFEKRGVTPRHHPALADGLESLTANPNERRRGLVPRIIFTAISLQMS